MQHILSKCNDFYHFRTYNFYTLICAKCQVAEMNTFCYYDKYEKKLIT